VCGEGKRWRRARGRLWSRLQRDPVHHKSQCIRIRLIWNREGRSNLVEIAQVIHDDGVFEAERDGEDDARLVVRHARMSGTVEHSLETGDSAG
jgi:hypothetical protein